MLDGIGFASDAAAEKCLEAYCAAKVDPDRRRETEPNSQQLGLG